MIYEFRTYDLKMGSLQEVIKRFAVGYEQRKELSEMAAFWYTDIGPLNQIIHVWKYADIAERDEIRKEGAKLDAWPPKIGDFILKQTIEIYNPWSFSPELTPGDHGPFYEMRSYLVQPGRMEEVKAGWEAAVPDRSKFSPLSAILECEMGTASKIVHIWPYKDLNQRDAVRKESIEAGVWPPSRHPNAPKVEAPSPILSSMLSGRMPRRRSATARSNFARWPRTSKRSSS